jgi:hypothetical protein
MKVIYKLKQDTVIHRIIMRLSAVEGISCSDRFFDRSIAIDTDDSDDLKIITMLNTLDLVENIDVDWNEEK